MEDVQTAMRFMKKHAGEYNGDADRMAMFCYSASGLPVLRTVEGDDKDLKVAAVVAWRRIRILRLIWRSEGD